MPYTPEETAEHRRLWVEALRSGEYEQGKGRLRTGLNFCCLGVACDIYLAQVGDGRWEEAPNYFEQEAYCFKVGHEDELISLPSAVAIWLGIQSTVVHLASEDEIFSLVQANDLENWTFDEIADAIEVGLPILAPGDDQLETIDDAG